MIMTTTGNPVSKFNKEQTKLIEAWASAIHCEPEENAEDQATSLKIFLTEFSEIDSTPDPETYCIWVKDEWKDESLYSGLTSIEKAANKLAMIMQDVNRNSVIEYKKGEYLLTFSGARYEIRKEE